MSKARTLASTVSTGAVLADGTIDASEIGSLTLPSGGDIVGTTSAQTLTNKTLTYADNTLTGVQAALVSGTSIKTVNSVSLLGSGNIDTPETNPAGSTGQVQYNNAGVFDAVASGTTGQVLTSAGSGVVPTWEAPAAGGTNGWHLLSTVTASASATVDIETTFDSTYDAYVIVATDADIADVLRCQLKLGGAYATANYKYLRTLKTNTGAGNAVANQTSSSDSNTVNIQMTQSAANLGFEMFIYGPAGTAQTKKVVWNGMTSISGGAECSGQGTNTAVTALTGVRFTSATGNINSGTFRLYGLAKT